LLDVRNCKHHPESFYTSCPLDELIQQAESSLNFSLTKIGSKDYNNNNIDGLSDKKDHKHHPESLHAGCPLSGSIQ